MMRGLRREDRITLAFGMSSGKRNEGEGGGGALFLSLSLSLFLRRADCEPKLHLREAGSGFRTMRRK